VPLPGPAEAPLLYIQVLGPLAARSGDRSLDLGPIKQRGVLAALVYSDGKLVTVGELIAGLWGQDPPPTATKMIHAFVSRLRSILGADAGRLETVGRSYRLVVGTDEVDLFRARQLARRAEDQRRADPGGALLLLDQATALWRGAPLADLADLPLALTARPALEEERLAVFDARIDVLLELGRNQEAIPELLRMTDEEPLRSRPHDRLMLALYRSGRQAEALDVFRHHRDTLAAELGLDPSQSAVTLQRQILRQDPSIMLAAPAPGPHAAPGVVTAAAPTRIVRRRKWPWAASAAVVMCGAVVGALTLSGHHPGADGTPAVGRLIASGSVISVDMATGTVSTSTSSVGHDPGPISISADSLWTASGDDHTVTRVDLKSGRVLSTYGLAGPAVGLVAGPDTVWISDGFDGTLSRLLIDADEVTQPFYPDGRVTGLVAVSVAGQDVWVALANHALVDLDSRSLQVKTISTLPQQADAVTVGGDAVWAIASNPGGAFRVQNGHVSDLAITGRPRAITAGLGSIWVATSEPNRLWRIALDGRVLGFNAVAGPPNAITASQDGVWIAEGTSGDLERVDPIGRRVQTILAIGHPIGGLAADGSQIWVTVD
jgi:DNA-binding SARP family transcriptional activator